MWFHHSTPSMNSSCGTYKFTSLINPIDWPGLFNLRAMAQFCQKALTALRLSRQCGLIAGVVRRRIFMTIGIFLLNCGAEGPSFVVLGVMPKTLHKQHKESIGFLL